MPELRSHLLWFIPLFKRGGWRVLRLPCGKPREDEHDSDHVPDVRLLPVLWGALVEHMDWDVNEWMGCCRETEVGWAALEEGVVEFTPYLNTN